MGRIEREILASCLGALHLEWGLKRFALIRRNSLFVASQKTDLKGDHDLVYGVLKADPDILVFVPRREAVSLESVWDALHTAKTWGDFRDKMPPDDYEEYMVACFDDCESPRPADEAPFKRADEGFLGTDIVEWPVNPVYRMDTYVPDAVMGLGTPIKNLFDYSYINAEHENEALMILRLEGYQAERNDSLVKAACGEWWVS
jgi:hypothetical protein